MPETSHSPESFVLPGMGEVLGIRWGEGAARLLAGHPDARPAGSSGDAARYSITRNVGSPAVRTHLVWTFVLDELAQVDAMADGGREAFEALAAAALAAFEGAPAWIDEGCQAIEEGATRLVVDRLDGRLRLEPREG